MAKNNNFSNRGTLRYEMKKQTDRFDRKMQKYENATLQKKYKEAGWGNKALREEISKFKSENQELTKKELAQGIKNITDKYENNRKSIKEDFLKQYKDKLSSLRNIVETTPIKYKIANDELDPGITLLGNARSQKTPNVSDNTELLEFHKKLNKDFFENIVNAFDVTSNKKQSATSFMKESLKNEVINHSNIKAKNVNQGIDSLLNSYEKMKKDKVVVGYDLETIGAKDANGIWKPRAITEYSFQTYNTETNKVINNATAVMGISKDDARVMYDEIIQAIENNTIKDNQDLLVTANRMMKYGHQKTRFEYGENGLVQAVDFVDEDAVDNVFNKEQIWEGFKKHINVYENAKTINGMKDYEYHFMKTIANIKENDYALLGFNDALFDSPIIDSQMNMIVDKYRNNTEAIKSIEEMFGGLNKVMFNPDKNKRLDLRAAINLAVDKNGYEAVYGKGYNDFLNEKALTSSMTVRQEYLVERHFNEAFNSGTAHLAVEDVRNLLRLGFESSDALEGRTLLSDLMNIIKNEYTPDKMSILSSPEQGVQKVLFANRNSQAVNYTGRGVLGFTVDKTNGSYKTGAGFMVGNASEAIGDVSRQNIKIGGHIDQNQFYSFGGIKKMTMTDEFISEANKHMPEYARREMYVVKLDKMIPSQYVNHNMATSTYLFFNELAEAEGQVSSMFNYIGDYSKNLDKKTTIAGRQVYAKDSVYKKVWKHNKAVNLDMIPLMNKEFGIYTEDKDLLLKNLNGRKIPQKLKTSSKYNLSKIHIREDKDFNSPKGYTFSPDRFGGDTSREGSLYRSKSDKDIKYVKDPYTGHYHRAHVQKIKIALTQEEIARGKTPYKYSLNVDEQHTFNVPNDLEIVYNRNRILKTGASLENANGDNTMKPIMSNNGKGYFMAIDKNENGEDLYADYFKWERYKKGEDFKPKTQKASDFKGGLQPATKIFNPDDNRFEFRGGNEITSEGILKLNPALSKEDLDIITGVSINDDGEIKVNIIGDSDIEISKAFEDTLKTKYRKNTTDRARRHAVDGIYKNSKRYAKLIEEIDKANEIGTLKVNTKDANEVKNYLLEVANKLSNSVSRNEILNGKDADSLVVAALGYVPKGSKNNQKYIYGSTLYNFIESNDIFHSRNQGMNNLYNFIANKVGIEKSFTQAFDDFNSPESSEYLTTTRKLESMYDYIINKAAMDTYSTPEELRKAINLAGEESGVSKADLKGYFEFDITGLGKEDKHLQKTINSLDDYDVLRVNLKNGDEYKLIDKVFKLYNGEFSIKPSDIEAKKASAMNRFINDISKRNKELFNNKDLAELVEDVTKGAKGGTISPQVIANRLIRGLNKVKEKDFTQGIIKTNFNIANLAANDNKVIKLANEYMNNGEILKEAYEKTSLFKNMYKNDKAAVKEVIDKYFMPTFNGKTGDDALEAILNQGIYTEKQKTVVALNWRKARETHQEKMGELFELISQGGGDIHFNKSGITIEMNGKMMNFDGLAKTRYENGMLYHQVGNSKVTAQLDLGWNSKTNDFSIESNLKEVFAKSYADFNMKKINKEIDAKEFSLDTLSYFVGKIQGSALEEAIISDFNLHERNSQFRLGLGDAIGRHLADLIGTEESLGRWGDLKTIDKNVISKIRKIVTSDNWKDGDKSITPELKELLVKNVIPMLKQTVKDEEVLRILDMATFSNKDTQVAKSSTDIHLAERYSQRDLDNFDNAQRPVTAAQKKVFKKKELEEGIKKYIEAVGNSKNVYVGNIIDNATTHNMKTVKGMAIDGIEQALTFGKANVGQVGLMAIVDNNFNKVISENNTVYQLNEEKKKAQFLAMKKKINVYEQEKVMDARLMDAVFEMGANKQFVSANKDYMQWINNIDSFSEDDLKKASRLANVKAQIKIIDGKIQYISNEGELVDRGETILKYIGFGDKETAESSKQFMGRLQYGVFEKKGELKLSDEEVSKFLQDNIAEVKRLSDSYGGGENNISKAANEILSEYFKTGFYVEDIRQKTYMKVMNEGVEKDMTNGLYVGLGQLDSRISNYMKNNSYQGRNLTDFADQVLTLTEIDKIFINNFKANDDFKTAQELKEAILAERYYDSVSMFDIIDEFKKSSMITSHAVAKHNNSGMIFENTLGSILSIYKKEAGGDHNKALERLKLNLANNDVIDMFDDNGKRRNINDVLEITEDGRLLHHTIKSNKANISSDTLKTVETLNVENLINMIKNDTSLKELVHEGVKVYDPTSSTKYKTTNVYGDAIKTNLKHKDGTLLKDVIVGTRAQSSSEVAIDAEYMTIYDHNTVKYLEEKAFIDKEIINNRIEIENLKNQKKNAIAKGDTTSKIDERINYLEKDNLMLRAQKSEIAEEMGNILEISKGKKVGNQEFGLYELQVLNSGTADSVSDFLRKESKGIDDQVLASLKANFSGILTESKDGSYELSKEYEGYKVLDGYMKNIKSRNMFKTTGDDTGLEVALTEDMLELDEYKHLKDTYRKMKDVANEHIGPDAKISVRYAEQAHQIESAHIAHRYNKRQGLISDETLEKYGFNKININDLVMSGSDAERLNINSMFNTNYLVNLDEFGTIALPKAGQITGDNDIKENFQKRISQIQNSIKEYRDLYALEQSEEALHAKTKIEQKIDDYKKDLEKSIYHKDGMIFNAGKTELEESFRVKSSSVSTLDSDIMGENSEAVSQALDLITGNNEKDSILLGKARINGKSIAELEKNGIYHDYMFVSSDVFKNLGYFDEEKMAKYFNVDIAEVANNLDAYKNKMKEALQTHGDIFMGERYPAIWIGSDKPMRVFLDDSITDTNRARLSVATMLSMNGDNDGDSISASLLRSEKGLNFLEYQLAKEKFIEDNITGSRFSDEAIAKIDEAMTKQFGQEAKFFKGLEAHMAIESITSNKTFANKGSSDMIEELQTAVSNGDLNSVKAIKFNSLYGGKLYANYGGTSSMEALAKNEDAVNDMISLANKLNVKAGNIINDISDKKIGDAGEYLTHLDNSFKIFDAMQNPDSYKSEFSKNQLEKLNELKAEFNITDEKINTMREEAVMRARWLDYNAETMAKSRKGSIGPINVALQQHRQAVNAMYDSSITSEHANKLLVQHISKEVEQEVISSKKGNVIFNITKTTDLINTYRKIWQDGVNAQMTITDINGNSSYMTARESLTAWMNSNLDDKKIKSIITEIESKTGSSFIRDTYGYSASEIDSSNIDIVRNKLTSSYIGTLDKMSESNYGKAVRRASRLGGNMVDDANVVAINRKTNATDMMLDFLTYGEDKISNPEKVISHGINTISSNAASKALSPLEAVANVGLKKSSALAVGALGVGVGMLVSGFAGGPIDQTSASDYAKEEEQKPQAMSVPTMMDNGGFAMKNPGSSGYIINVRANTNKDLTQTKKVLRQAAQASVGGGVSVNMNIKEQSERYNERDIESLIAGIF